MMISIGAWIYCFNWDDCGWGFDFGWAFLVDFSTLCVSLMIGWTFLVAFLPSMRVNDMMWFFGRLLRPLCESMTWWSIFGCLLRYFFEFNVQLGPLGWLFCPLCETDDLWYVICWLVTLIGWLVVMWFDHLQWWLNWWGDRLDTVKEWKKWYATLQKDTARRHTIPSGIGHHRSSLVYDVPSSFLSLQEK